MKWMLFGFAGNSTLAGGRKRGRKIFAARRLLCSLYCGLPWHDPDHVKK
jgi:hypothetical protein